MIAYQLPKYSARCLTPIVTVSLARGSMSVANAEEARRALNLARTYQDKGSLSAALKWARKSSNLSPSTEADDLAASLESDIASGKTNNTESSSSAKASGAQAHPSANGAHHRPGHGSSSTSAPQTESPRQTPSNSKDRSYTSEQIQVVKRVVSCKGHEYYSILSGEPNCSMSYQLRKLITLWYTKSAKDMYRWRGEEGLQKGQSVAESYVNIFT